MKQITKKQVIEFFESKENKNIVFRSYFNCKKIKLSYLIANTVEDGILKQNLKVEVRSDFILLNGSRLDLIKNTYFLDNDVLIIISNEADNILIYKEELESPAPQNNSQRIKSSLIRMMCSNINDFNCENRFCDEVEKFLKDNNISFIYNQYLDYKHYKLELNNEN
jgi:hypothetical protein